MTGIAVEMRDKECLQTFSSYFLSKPGCFGFPQLISGFPALLRPTVTVFTIAERELHPPVHYMPVSFLCIRKIGRYILSYSL